MSNIIIKIQKTVVEDIIDFAKANYPNEFFAFLEGKIRNEEIIVSNLAYHPFESNSSSAVTTSHMGTYTQGFIGSVHSHPSGSNYPSKQDVKSFSKDGGIHLIISSPFTSDKIRCFDYNGKEIKFEIITI